MPTETPEQRKARLSAMSEYGKEYRNRPDVKARRKAQRDARYADKKEEILAKAKARREEDPELGREAARRYYQQHKAERAAAHRAWAKANPEKMRAYVAKSRAKDPAKARMRGRTSDANRREANKAKNKKWREENKERHLFLVKRWKANNPDRVRAIDTKNANKRRAAKRATRQGTDRKAYLAFVRAVKTAESITCYWCGKPVPKGKRHIDHIVPLNKRGADEVNNLCCACAHCNCSKKDKLPHEFTGQFELFAPAT